VAAGTEAAERPLLALPHRALFSCVPGFGHFHPLVPLARAFARAGHEVAFATSPYFKEHVEAAGFSFLPAGIDHAERWARFEPFQAEHLALPLEERRAFLFPHMFGTIEAPAKIDELREIVRAGQPDLIIHDSADLAAPVAAEEAGVPSVNHSFGRLVAVDIVAAAASAAGLSADPLGGMFRGIYVDIAPPSFQTEALPAGARVEHLRPVPVEPPSTERVPEWLDRLPEQPTVYITLGTVFNDLSVFRVLLDALADVDCNVIATVGPRSDPAELGPTPENAYVERYISQSLVLPLASVAVAHGGSGSTLAALAHGLPMLVVPQGADQFENAAQCVSIGAAKLLLPPELTVDTARSAVSALLTEPSYRERARDLAGEIRSLPEPDALVSILLDAGV
jgi:UDP:flavonoid glycosyltransferase YjiC (YdhE family)